MTSTMKQLARAAGGQHVIHERQTGAGIEYQGALHLPDGSTVHAPAKSDWASASDDLRSCLLGSMPWVEHQEQVRELTERLASATVPLWSQPSTHAMFRAFMELAFKGCQEQAQSGMVDPELRKALRVALIHCLNDLAELVADIRAATAHMRAMEADPLARGAVRHGTWRDLAGEVEDAALFAASGATLLGVPRALAQVTLLTSTDDGLSVEVALGEPTWAPNAFPLIGEQSSQTSGWTEWSQVVADRCLQDASYLPRVVLGLEGAHALIAPGAALSGSGQPEIEIGHAEPFLH